VTARFPGGGVPSKPVPGGRVAIQVQHRKSTVVTAAASRRELGTAAREKPVSRTDRAVAPVARGHATCSSSWPDA
jgi:hypothetical protein